MTCESTTRMDGKVVIVTGGSSGVGLDTAKNLAKLGARIILASRNETKLINAKKEIQDTTGNYDVVYKSVDLASLKSVRRFANDVMNNEDRIDVLINNAGAIGLPDRLTEDGLNLTMQVNYFGVFLLTYLLIPMLKASAPSRIITGTAASMYIGEIDFDHWNDVGRYDFISSLSNSKLADTLFAIELENRLKGTGVTSNSYDPFVVPDTGVLNNLPEALKEVAEIFMKIVGQPKEDVGKQITLLASDPELYDISGEHFKFCTIWVNHWLASDKELTRRLWEATKQIVKISPDEDWEHRFNKTRNV